MTFANDVPAALPRPDAFAVLTVAAAALLALALGWSLAETRLVGGDPAWVKPAKFALSFIVHFATLSLIVRRLSPRAQASRPVQWTAAVMAAAFLGEMAYIFAQAAQAEASHFNVSTSFNIAMYQLMGAGAVLLVAGPLLVARAAARDQAANLGGATLAGIRWGAWLGFGLTLVVAGYMSSGSGHFVGTPGPGAATLPITGWSAEIGDLRPAHFLALHAFQALPLAGIWMDRTGHGPAAIRWVALGWAVLTLAVFAQALMGLPLIRL